MYILLFKEAWISIFSNKLRTLLTLLGVIIGVMAVVLMVAIGQAVQLEIDKQLDGFGSNMMIIVPASRSRSGVHGGRGGSPTLTVSDTAAIKNIKGVVNTAPMMAGSYQVKYGNENWNTRVQASNTEFVKIGENNLKMGTMFTESDVRSGTPVAVIGDTIYREVFRGKNPIGEDIKIKGIPFKVIGVFEAKGAGASGNDRDDVILVPLRSFKIRLTTNRFPESVYTIFVKFDDAKNMRMIENRIYALLGERHNITDEDYDFEVINLTEIIQKISIIGLAVSILLTSVASISLLVASIGIMNMMLSAVTERTKEIGIRKAIGAPNRSILFQFLIEAILISLIGGVFGITIGIGLGQLAGNLLGYKVPVSVITIMISIIVAIIVGVLSGIVPAVKATKLNPIDALRYS
ncbi:MAG: ABC transporter permease [Rickettsiales bacterium]|jgi:putative ABC transport system permease protein|nr:ABC transporter permease [Rickettsiales bacterium]